MAKREKTEFEANAMEFFATHPIEEWEAYIKAEQDAKKADLLKLYAERKLTIANMKAYIKANDPTPQAKDAFIESTLGILYKKYPEEHKKKGQYILDENKQKIPVLDEKGNPKKKQSIVYAKKYFVTKYAPYLERVIEEKPKAFDALLDW